MSDYFGRRRAKVNLSDPMLKGGEILQFPCLSRNQSFFLTCIKLKEQYSPKTRIHKLIATQFLPQHY